MQWNPFHDCITHTRRVCVCCTKSCFDTMKNINQEKLYALDTLRTEGQDTCLSSGAPFFLFIQESSTQGSPGKPHPFEADKFPGTVKKKLCKIPIPKEPRPYHIIFFTSKPHPTPHPHVFVPRDVLDFYFS